MRGESPSPAARSARRSLPACGARRSDSRQRPIQFSNSILRHLRGHLAPRAGRGRRVAPGEGDSPQAQCAESPPHPPRVPRVGLSPHAGRGDRTRGKDLFNFQTAYFVIASQRVRAKRGPMTGSAKQSRATRAALDCFVADAPRNDKGETCVRILAARFARVMHQRHPHREQRAQGRPGGRMHPGLPRKENLRERVNHRYRR